MVSWNEMVVESKFAPRGTFAERSVSGHEKSPVVIGCVLRALQRHSSRCPHSKYDFTKPAPEIAEPLRKKKITVQNGTDTLYLFCVLFP